MAADTISIEPLRGELAIVVHFDLPGSGPFGALKSSRRTAGAGIESVGAGFEVVQLQAEANALFPQVLLAQTRQ